jgi:hypothetical protein
MRIRQRTQGGKHVSWSKLELAWKVSLAPWLSCRQVQEATGANRQTVCNMRRDARKLRSLFPRLRVYRVGLREARALLGGKRSSVYRPRTK